MSDITMCHANNGNGGMCPMRGECSRYMDTPHSFRQTYYLNAPYVLEAQGDGLTYTCKKFLPTEGRKDGVLTRFEPADDS